MVRGDTVGLGRHPYVDAAIGTSGSLLAAMLIIQRDRINGLRKPVNELSAQIKYGSDKSFKLVIENPLERAFHDLEFCALAPVTFLPVEDGGRVEDGYVGLRCKIRGVGRGVVLTFPSFWAHDFNESDSPQLIKMLVTDPTGRTWLRERKRVDRLITVWTRRWVQHNRDRFVEAIQLRTGDDPLRCPCFSYYDFDEKALQSG